MSTETQARPVDPRTLDSWRTMSPWWQHEALGKYNQQLPFRVLTHSHTPAAGFHGWRSDVLLFFTREEADAAMNAPWSGQQYKRTLDKWMERFSKPLAVRSRAADFRAASAPTTEPAK